MWARLENLEGHGLNVSELSLNFRGNAPYNWEHKPHSWEQEPTLCGDMATDILKAQYKMSGCNDL